MESKVVEIEYCYHSLVSPSYDARNRGAWKRSLENDWRSIHPLPSSFLPFVRFFFFLLSLKHFVKDIPVRTNNIPFSISWYADQRWRLNSEIRGVICFTRPPPPSLLLFYAYFAVRYSISEERKIGWREKIESRLDLSSYCQTSLWQFKFVN